MSFLKYGIFIGLVIWMGLIIFAFNISILAGIFATALPLFLMAFLAD